MKTILQFSLFTVLLFFTAINSFGQIGNYKAGVGAGFSNSSGDFNTFVGDSAGYTNTTGLYNTFIGYHAGYSLSFPSFTQSDNTIIGAEAMGGIPFSVSSTDNVIIGKRAGYNHYGTDAVIIGTHAGYNNQNGADVVFIGEEAGRNNTEGDDNVFVGEDAGYNNTTASDNTFVGNQSGRSNTTGFRNAFLGNEAGWDNSTGYRNTFIGDSAGIDVGVGHHNTFIGQAAGSCTEHADYNTFVGSRAGWDNNRTNETNNANYNTYLGYHTGYTNREGQYNVLLGALTDFSSTAMGGNGATNSYNIGIGYDALINGERVYSGVIGANARVSSDNSFVIGGTTAVTRMSVGIGTDTPNQNASLDLAEVDKGFLITRMSDSERTTFTAALSGTDEGMMVYDSTANNLSIWDGTKWMGLQADSLALSSNTLSLLGSNSVNLAAYLDNTDAQDLSLTGNTLALTNDATTIDLSSYLDNTDNQDLGLTGNTLSLSNDATTVDLSAYLDNTDTQTVTLTGTDLSISNGNSVDLSALKDGYEANTDNQDLNIAGNTLSLSNDATTVDLSAYLDNTDTQTVTLTGTDLSISNGNSVDLSTLKDGYEANTDNQDLNITGNTLSLSNDATTVDLSAYMDNTDAQTVALTGTDLSISNGNSVDLSALKDGYEANTDNQDLNIAGNTLSLSNDATTVDLSAYLDNTDTQTVTLTGTDLSISNGNSVDLSALKDGYEANTDNQDLNIAGNTLSLSNDATTVDLSAYLDNTDTQTVTLTGTNLSISNGNSVDLSALKDGYEANTDNQSLQLNGSNLSIDGGNTVDLSGLTGNNSNQNLSLSGTTLSIDNGNQVNLSAVQDGFEANTDQQNLSGSLNGNTIKIDIENGTSAQIDLSSLLENIYEILETQANKIEELESELATLRDVHENDKSTSVSSAQLFQNIPNPTKGNTKLSYYLPNNTPNSQILISDSKGVRIKTISNLQIGTNSININANELSAGTYLCTLVVSGKIINTKKMLIIN